MSDSIQSTVLLVEDNPSARKLFRVTLEAHGYRVLVASDARTAIAHLTREPVGLVIQDLCLPDMEGMGLLHALRALPHGVGLPVVVVSGFKTLLEQLQCGADGFTVALIKPVEPSTLVETVCKYLPLPARVAAVSSQGKTILVVDDDPIHLRQLRLRLEHEGFVVIEAGDEKAALAAASAKHPDAVLCDVLMTGADAYDLCLAVHGTPGLRHVPVILVSVYYGGAREEELARSVGAAGFVTRTPDLEGVLAALRTALATVPDAPSPVSELWEHKRRGESVIAQLKRQARANAGFADRAALQAAQLSILAGIAEALLRSGSIEAALDGVLTSCLDVGGISRGAQYRVTADNRLTLTHSVGFPSSAEDALESAFGCAVQLMESALNPVISVRACLEEAQISTLFAASDVAEAVLICLREDQCCIGALLLGSSAKEMSEQDLLTFGCAIAAQLAQAAALADAFKRLRDGAEAGRLLNLSLDLEQVLTSLGQLATQRLGDVCEVRLGGADARVFSSKRALDPSWADQRARLELVVPMIAQGHPLGSVTFARVRSRSAFSSADRSAVEDLVARATSAISNAVLYKAANDASRMKDEFLATISHELRTPLTAILGWSGMLTGSVDEATREQAYRVITRNALAQQRLIDDLVDTSRITSGKMRLELQPLELSRVVDAALESAGPSLALKGIELRRSIPKANALVMGDPSRLQQVVWNLLSNAIKFTPTGGRVDIAVERAGECMRLTVRDTGEGIEDTFLGSVFDRFKQADSTISRRHSGLGLGLAIARHLVELHGGTISAHSAGNGHGSLFTVELPLSVVHSPKAQSLPPPPSYEDARTAGLESMVVLVVDDDADLRDLITTLLIRWGARVATASCTAEALALVAQHPPDVILSDIGMPGEDGYALMRRLRRMPPNRGGAIPAAAVTAFARAEDKAKAIAAGFQLHLAKPIDPGQLMVAVTALHKMRGVEMEIQ